MSDTPQVSKVEVTTTVDDCGVEIAKTIYVLTDGTHTKDNPYVYRPKETPSELKLGHLPNEAFLL